MANGYIDDIVSEWDSIPSLERYLLDLQHDEQLLRNDIGSISIEKAHEEIIAAIKIVSDRLTELWNPNG